MYKVMSFKTFLIIINHFSVFSSSGRRPASLCHGPLSDVGPSACPSVHASVCALTFSLTISQTSPGFYVSVKQVLKTMKEKEKLLVTSNFSFSHSVFYLFGELYAIFINLKLSSANCLSLEESEICHLGNG